MKRAFVTGGSGFVGRTLISTLLDRSVEVHALARSDAAAHAVAASGAEPIPGDLDDVHAMVEGMQGCDAVFHAAAKVDVWGDPVEFERVNVQGTRNVVEAARRAGMPVLVHVSTEAVLAGGPPLIDADESWPYPARPAGLYPFTKGKAERIVLESSTDSLRTVAIRPPLIWGKGDTSVLPKIAAAVKSGQWMWFGGGHYPHATTHVQNVIEGLLLAYEHGKRGEVYFVTDGVPQDFRDFMTAQLRAIGVERDSRSIPYGVAHAFATLTETAWSLLGLRSMPPLPRSVLYLMGQKLTVSDAKARRDLGYEGRMTPQRGLAELAGRR